jgi:hypothetical protein
VACAHQRLARLRGDHSTDLQTALSYPDRIRGGKDARMAHSESKLLIVALILTFALAVAAFGMVLLDW